MVNKRFNNMIVVPIVSSIAFLLASMRCYAIVLPIEVVGEPGTSESVTITLPENAPKVTGIDLKINNIEYPNEIDLRVNKGSWISLNNKTATTFGAGYGYGGIGSPVVTLNEHVHLPNDLVTAGSNTVTFKFDYSDGNCSGFRVLALWFTDSNNKQVVDSTPRIQEDPGTWTPPLNDPKDIAEGLKLWRTATLKSSFGPDNHTLQAHCQDCHASTGMDLKYFNFSNKDIIARSEFHGLSPLQGKQIASYIRSLPASDGSVDGRPWNPPFQPGPGLSSRTNTQWSAGAGNSAILARDADEAHYLFPKGISQAAIQKLATPGPDQLNPRDIPISLPLLTWDQWLPKEAPQDIFGVKTFHNSQMYKMLANRSSQLWVPINNTVGGGLDKWLQTQVPLRESMNAYGPKASWNRTVAQQAYSIAQWVAIHTWQIEQEHFLAYPASKLNWFTNIPFGVSPNTLKIPSGMVSGTVLGDVYLGSAWYQIQLSVDSGDNHPGGNSPIDWAYYPGVISHLYSDGAPAQPMRLTEGFLIAMRNFDGPIKNGQWGGWDPAYQDNILSIFSWPPLALWHGQMQTFRSVMDALLPVWLERANSYSPREYYKYEYVSSESVPSGYMAANWYSGLWGEIPILRKAGVNPDILNQLANFGKTVFPKADWSSQLNL